MLKPVAIASLIVYLLLPLELSAQKGRSSSSRSSKSSASKSKKSSSSDKPVHVREYKRKDATTVREHNRSLLGTKTKRTTSSRPSSSGIPQKSTVAARDAHGRIQRSEEARKQFMKQTGYPNGRKGYVVDHVDPLECGGADAPSNMQWQTVAEAKIKDRTERNCRRE